MNFKEQPYDNEMYGKWTYSRKRKMKDYLVHVDKEDDLIVTLGKLQSLFDCFFQDYLCFVL